MRARYASLRACLRPLLLCLSLGALLPGCSAIHHHEHADVGCKHPVFTGNADNLGPLKAPPGLTTPNTAQQVKIPPLDAADPARPRSAPCLDWPPQYVNEPLLPPVRRPNS